MLDIANTEPGGGRAVPALRVEAVSGGLRVVASGAWTVRDFAEILGDITALKLPKRPGQIRAEIDLDGVRDLDTAGAWLLNHLRAKLTAAGIAARFRGGSQAQSGLIAVVESSMVGERPPPRRRKVIAPLIGDAFTAIAKAVQDCIQLTAFLGVVTRSAMRTAFRPWRFRWVSFIHHIEHTGLRAVPIIALICLLIGAVITQQSIIQLQIFGAEPLAIDMLGILALREVGVLLTAIMVAGRSASAFTAEIGTMKTREEIDAMRTLGIDPIETLVLPRIAALIVTLPILAFIGDIACLAGGALIAFVYLDISLENFVQRLHDAVNLRHFVVGLVKAPLAALIIGLVGCLEGLNVRGSAESLGTHVTSSVVKAIFLVIIFDALFAMFLSASGF
jgi:phospholipid/cholesterol/gamma-HCH transport system permease protein